MRVKIEYIVEVDEDLRRAIRHHYGKKGLAKRDEIKDWYQEQGKQGDMDLLDDLSRH